MDKYERWGEMEMSRTYPILRGDHLLDFDIANIILEASTGILYKIQCGGSVCDHAVIEGCLIRWNIHSEQLATVRKILDKFDECGFLGCSMVHNNIDDDGGYEYFNKRLELPINSKSTANDIEVAHIVDEFLEKINTLIVSTPDHGNHITLKVNREVDVLYKMREGLIPVLIDFKSYKPSTFTRDLKGWVHFGNCD